MKALRAAEPQKPKEITVVAGDGKHVKIQLGGDQNEDSRRQVAEAEGSVRCGTEVDLGSGPAELGLERQHEDAEAPVVARDRDAQAEETRQGQRQRAPLLLVLGHRGGLGPQRVGAPARAG